MLQGFSRELGKTKDQLDVIQKRLFRSSPRSIVEKLNVILKKNLESLCYKMQFYLQLKRSTLRATTARFHALNPLAILDRGYSVTRVLPDYALVKDVRQVSVGQQVDVTLSRGGLLCRIERKRENGQTDI